MEIEIKKAKGTEEISQKTYQLGNFYADISHNFVPVALIRS